MLHFLATWLLVWQVHAQSDLEVNTVGGDTLFGLYKAYGPYKHIKSPWNDLMRWQTHPKKFTTKKDRLWHSSDRQVPYMCYMVSVPHKTYLGSAGCKAVMTKTNTVANKFWLIKKGGNLACLRSVLTGKYLHAMSWLNRKNKHFGETHWNRPDCEGHELWRYPMQSQTEKGVCGMRNYAAAFSAKSDGSLWSGPKAIKPSPDAHFKLYCRATKTMKATKPRFAATHSKVDMLKVWQAIGKFHWRKRISAQNLFYGPRGNTVVSPSHLCYFQNPATKLYMKAALDFTGTASKTLGDENKFWVQNTQESLCIRTIHGFYFNFINHIDQFGDGPVLMNSLKCDSYDPHAMVTLDAGARDWVKLNGIGNSRSIAVTSQGKLFYAKRGNYGNAVKWNMYCKDSKRAKAPKPYNPTHTQNLWNVWYTTGSWFRLTGEPHEQLVRSIWHQDGSKEADERNAYLCSFQTHDKSYLQATDDYGISFSKTNDARNKFWLRYVHGTWCIRTIHGKYLTSWHTWKENVRATEGECRCEKHTCFQIFTWKSKKKPWFTISQVHRGNNPILYAGVGKPAVLKKTQHNPPWKTGSYKMMCKFSKPGKTCKPGEAPAPPPAPKVVKPSPPKALPKAIPKKVLTKVVTTVVQKTLGFKAAPSAVKKIVRKIIRRKPTPRVIRKMITKVIRVVPRRHEIRRELRVVVKPPKAIPKKVLTKIVTTVVQKTPGAKAKPSVVRKIVRKIIRRKPTPRVIRKIITRVIGVKPRRREIRRELRRTVVKPQQPRGQQKGVGRWIWVPRNPRNPSVDRGLPGNEGPQYFPLVPPATASWPIRQPRTRKGTYHKVVDDALYRQRLRQLLYRDRINRLRHRRDIRDVLFRKRLRDLINNPPRCGRR